MVKRRFVSPFSVRIFVKKFGTQLCTNILDQALSRHTASLITRDPTPRRVQFMEDTIDAIITWVDGNDPNWKAKKDHALKTNINYKISDEGNLSKRYKECDEIFYCIHFIRKNAPWINTIYLITDNQRPSWLNIEMCKKLDICIVSHEEIFSEHPHALPTFNSRSIETAITNIPSLSEKFIYFNDDVFIVKKVTPNDFFDGQKLVVRGRIGMKKFVLDKLFRLLTKPFFSSGYTFRRPGIKKLPGFFFYIDMAHTPHALFKSDFQKIFNKSLTAHNVSYRFRGQQQISPIGFVANCSKYFRKVKRVDNDWACFYSSDDKKINNINNYLKEHKDIKFLCLNDLADVNETTLKEIYKNLDQILAA